MKVKVSKAKRTLKTYERMIKPDSLFTYSDGIVARVICVAEHRPSSRKLVIINQNGKDIAVPLCLFCVEYTKILDEGDVPF